MPVSLQSLSSISGLPVDILKTAIILVSNIFLSALFPCLKTPFLRQIYSLLIGLIELIFLLQQQSIYIIGFILITIGIIKALKIKPFIVTIVCSVIALLAVHLHRFIIQYDDWKMDCSVYVMILVTKLTYYGFQLESSKRQQQLQPSKGQQQLQSSKRLQSLVSYFSYCLFFPSLLVGPTFSFSRYQLFINRQQQYKQIKFCLKNVLNKLAIGIIVSLITILSMPIFNHQWVLTNETYQNYSFGTKMLIISFIGFLYRVKFYAAWYLAQATVNISGLSYSLNGNNDSVLAGSLMFQLQPNPKNKTQFWNSSIQTWLKVVVYDNIIRSIKNPTLAVFGTFFVSAFWHGVYLSYYIGFIQWGILAHLTKWIYKMSFALPNNIRQSKWSTVLAFIVGTISLNYLGMGIVLLEWENMVAFYSQLHYSISIGLIVMLVLSFIIKPPRQSKQVKQVKKD